LSPGAILHRKKTLPIICASILSSKGQKEIPELCDNESIKAECYARGYLHCLGICGNHYDVGQ